MGQARNHVRAIVAFETLSAWRTAFADRRIDVGIGRSETSALGPAFMTRSAFVGGYSKPAYGYRPNTWATRSRTLGSPPFRCPGSLVPEAEGAEGSAVVIPPGGGYRGDWQWWVAAVLVLVSVLAVMVGLVLLLR
jgi:hypothetical protein